MKKCARQAQGTPEILNLIRPEKREMSSAKPPPRRPPSFSILSAEVNQEPVEPAETKPSGNKDSMFTTCILLM